MKPRTFIILLVAASVAVCLLGLLFPIRSHLQKRTSAPRVIPARPANLKSCSAVPSPGGLVSVGLVAHFKIPTGCPKIARRLQSRAAPLRTELVPKGTAEGADFQRNQL